MPTCSNRESVAPQRAIVTSKAARGPVDAPIWYLLRWPLPRPSKDTSSTSGIGGKAAGCRHLRDSPGLWPPWTCLLYTSDAADERSSVDLGGRRIIKKKKKT